MSKKPTRPTGGPKRHRKDRGSTNYGEAISDELQAMIWTLTEEGNSQREGAAKLKISPVTFGKYLALDPIRLEGIRARQREARSQAWKKLENVCVGEALEWVDVLTKARPGFNANGKGQISTRKLDRIAVIPRILTSLKGLGGEGSKQVQILTGGVTERIGDEQGGELTAEQLVQQAIDRGLVDKLPARLREYARQVEKAGKHT